MNDNEDFEFTAVKIPLEKLNLSKRVMNTMAALHIEYAEELAELSHQDLKNCRNIGEGSINEIQRALATVNLKLKGMPKRGRAKLRYTISAPDEQLELLKLINANIIYLNEKISMCWNTIESIKVMKQKELIFKEKELILSEKQSENAFKSFFNRFIPNVD